MSDPQKPVVVTIDGPAGAGKSTSARSLSVALDYAYVDTGAMYRALTLKAMRGQMDFNDQPGLVRLAADTVIDLQGNPQRGIQVFLDGEDVTEDIRSRQVTNYTGLVACAAGVRELMVQWQRRMGRGKSLVIEGRDAGTIIFPDADFKFYLDADPAERTQRRLKEWKAKGIDAREEEVLKDMIRRDQTDMRRKASPLKKAEDALVIDTTGLTIEQTVEKMVKIIKEKKIEDRK